MKFCHGIAEGVAEKGRGVGVTHFSQENVYYRPQTKFAKVMFLHLSVSHSVHRGGLHRGLGRPPPPPSDTTGYSQRAGGTYPTEMHSCLTML